MNTHGVGFRTLDVELADEGLPTTGSIPTWLSGALIRNGPGAFEAGGERVAHWFDGLAMLTKFAFDSGDVAYSNRFLRTEARESALESGFSNSEFASSGSYLKRVKALVTGESTDNANVAVARFDGEFVAMTETPRRIAFDPATLETSGEFEYADDLSPHHITAHLERDDDAGETWGYFTRFGRSHEYVVYRLPDGSRRREVVARVDVDDPAYMHSFALSKRHVALVEPPFVTNPLKFLLPGSGAFIDNYEWEPERRTRILVFDRETGERVRTCRTEPFFVFHTVNAFDAADEFVVDLIAYPDASIVDGLYLDRVAGGDGEPKVPDGRLVRLRVPLDGGDVEYDRRYRGMELPRTSPTVRGREYRFAYGQATHRYGQNGLVKVDVETGEATEWWADDCYAEEPVFVPRPGGDGDGDAEDAGVVLAPVLDAAAEETFLLVLDGETFEELARATVPHALPFGFHGQYFEGVR